VGFLHNGGVAQHIERPRTEAMCVFRVKLGVAPPRHGVLSMMKRGGARRKAVAVVGMVFFFR
jgi:hypothetical protein